MPKNNGKKTKKQPKNTKKVVEGKAFVKVNKFHLKETKAPMAVGYDMQTYFRESPIKHKMGDEVKDAILVEGCEYLGPVVVPDPEVPGAAYEEFYLSPSEFAGTRLASYAKLYEKFLFKESDFMYLPAVGAETPGQLVIAYDRDISDPTPPSTQQGVRQYLAMEDQKSGNVWTPHTAKCPLRAPETGFYTNPVVGGDDRLAYQGQVYVACVVPSGLTAGATLGTAIIRYKCVFFIPQLQDDLAQLVVADANDVEEDAGSQDIDFLSLPVTASPPTFLEGVQQWLPQLQGDGTHAIKLAEGLYNLIATLSGGNNDGAADVAAAFYPPTLEPLEPASAPAPQPQVQKYFDTQGIAEVEEPLNQEPAWMGYLNIPKGGALLRLLMNLGSTNAINLAGVVAGINILRMSGASQNTLPVYPSPSSVTGKIAKKLGVDIKQGEGTLKYIERIAKAKADLRGKGRTVPSSTTASPTAVAANVCPFGCTESHVHKTDKINNNMNLKRKSLLATINIVPPAAIGSAALSGGNAAESPPVGANRLVDRERR
jgi:hypothetical protein